MTVAEINENDVILKLSKSEAVVLFEWLSRNWERTQWKNDDLFLDPAEKKILILLENNLANVLSEPFDRDYPSIVSRFYREILPDSDVCP